MPSFKPKATKKIKVCKKYSTTLDGKHKEFRLDGVLIRSELEDEYELYKSKFD